MTLAYRGALARSPSSRCEPASGSIEDAWLLAAQQGPFSLHLWSSGLLQRVRQCSQAQQINLGHFSGCVLLQVALSDPPNYFESTGS